MPVPESISPIERPTMNRDVCARLRQWILDGVLQPGEVIRDHSLAEGLGVSRTPVREALLLLEAEGYVETARNRWTRVTPVSVEAAAQIYPILASLQELALRTQAPSLGAERAKALRRANSALEQALAAHAGRAAVIADADFHRLIAEGAGNRELILTTGRLAEKLRRVELAYFSLPLAGRASVAEHARLIRAVEKGEVEAAVAASSGNWANSLQRLKDAASGSRKQGK